MKRKAALLLALMLLLSALLTPMAFAARGKGPRRDGGRGALHARHQTPIESDLLAPIITRQPDAVPYAIEGSGYAAPLFSVTAALPSGANGSAIGFQWIADGQCEGDTVWLKPDASGVAICEWTADSLTELPAGVYPVYCRVLAVDSAAASIHESKTYVVNFIVCKGLQRDTLIAFSDVHEAWDNVGAAIRDFMGASEGYAPALVLATGDFSNGGSGAASTDEAIGRIQRQLGGIETLWVAGNHDDAQALPHTASCLLYDSRSTDNTVCDGLIVIGLGYEQLDGTTGADYGAEGSTDTAYAALEASLDAISQSYSGELVVIAAHAGLHALGIDPASQGASEWAGGDRYNVAHAADIVRLINRYAEQMNILFLFGHDHSKGEREFVKLPGEEITATVDASKAAAQNLPLAFSYAHSGYIMLGSGGQQRYSILSWDSDSITRTMRELNGEALPDLSIHIHRRKVR